MIVIDSALLNKLSVEASTSTRKRKNLNFHTESKDTLQRMLNAFEPGTYVRPHKHENPDKREVFIILAGKAAIIQFDDQGEVIKSVILDQKSGILGVEIPPKVFHTIISLEKGTVMYELKDGPYVVENDKNFAHWAPEEGHPDAEIYLQNILSLIEN